MRWVWVENNVAQPNKLMELKKDVLAKLVDSSERASALLDAVANLFKKPMDFWKNRQVEYAKEIGGGCFIGGGTLQPRRHRV